MDKTVARLNIEHYRKSLATEQDETKRQTLMRLLAEEQAKLAALDPPEAALSIAPRTCAWARTSMRVLVSALIQLLTAWKRESVHALVTYDCEFKIAIKWRGCVVQSINFALV